MNNLILVILLYSPIKEMDALSNLSVNKYIKIFLNSSNMQKYGKNYQLLRGKSCKFVPQKVGLGHILMDEDVIQIYKSKTKTQIKKEKAGVEVEQKKTGDKGKKKK